MIYHTKNTQQNAPPTLASYPGVTILRPLKGLDPSLEYCLRSSFELDYPTYQLIFSVASAEDPAIPVVRKLIEEYPQIDAMLLVGDKQVGINPKINNMIRGYDAGKYDIFWICDSNIYVNPGSLGRSVKHFADPTVGMVHHVPRALNPTTFGGTLESLYFASTHARQYIFINALSRKLWPIGLRITCVIGKSSFIKKSILERIGGLAHYGQYLAEDFTLGRDLAEQNYKLLMTDDIASQILGRVTPTDYALRRVRWGRLRRFLIPGPTLLEPFAESLMSSLVGAFGMALIWGIHPLSFIGFHYVVWFVFDVLLFRTLMHQKIANYRAFLLAWSFREFVYLPLYFMSIMGNTVEWRGQRYKLLFGGGVKLDDQQEDVTDTDMHVKVWWQSASKFIQPVLSTAVIHGLRAIRLLVEILIVSERNGRSNPSESSVDQEGTPSKLKSPDMDDDLRKGGISLRHRRDSTNLFQDSSFPLSQDMSHHSPLSATRLDGCGDRDGLASYEGREENRTEMRRSTSTSFSEVWHQIYNDIQRHLESPRG